MKVKLYDVVEAFPKNTVFHILSNVAKIGAKVGEDLAQDALLAAIEHAAEDAPVKAGGWKLNFVSERLTKAVVIFKGNAPAFMVKFVG